MSEQLVTRVPADEAQHPGPPARRPSGASVLGALLLLVGVLWLLDATGAMELRWQVVLPAVLTVLGLALLATARFARHDGLIAAGVVLSVLVVLSAAAPAAMSSPPLGGVGDRTERPSSLPETGATYELGIGKLTVDLRTVTLPASGGKLSASVGIGDLTVRLPEGVGADVRAETGAGEIVIPGATRDGVGVSVVERIPGRPTVTLDLSAGVGKVEVRR